MPASPPDVPVSPPSTRRHHAWLVRRLTRVEDDHVADVAGAEQVWTAAGRPGAFGPPRLPVKTDEDLRHGGEHVVVDAGVQPSDCGVRGRRTEHAMLLQGELLGLEHATGPLRSARRRSGTTPQ
ncbi:hypothetical protein CHR28_34110 [Streptomyces sp. XY006]|nr:hypothetical protein CHR28_34110 [Streptomyces sp. XY006]